MRVACAQCLACGSQDNSVVGSLVACGFQGLGSGLAPNSSSCLDMSTAFEHWYNHSIVRADLVSTEPVFNSVFDLCFLFLVSKYRCLLLIFGTFLEYLCCYFSYCGDQMPEKKPHGRRVYPALQFEAGAGSLLTLNPHWEEERTGGDSG